MIMIIWGGFKMTEELKTLKDIDKLVFNTDYADWKQLEKTNDNNYVLLERKATNNVKELLKQEAIKWIKFLDTDEHYDTDFAYDPYEVIPFIKHFFNIEDKDLE